MDKTRKCASHSGNASRVRSPAWLIGIISISLLIPAQKLWAQATATQISSPPPLKLLTTPGGVDMRTGRYNYSQTDVSIGDGTETGGIQFTRGMSVAVRGHNDPFANLSHNWDIFITETRVNINNGLFKQGQGSDFRMSVRFAGRSETFQSLSTETAYTQTSEASSAKLTYTSDRVSASTAYTYQASDGTIVLFRPIGSASGPTLNNDCSSFFRCAYASEITLPDGTKFTLGYETSPGATDNSARLRSVVSSRGYALLLEYAGTGASWNLVSKSCVINLATAPKPSTDICPSGAPAATGYTYTAFSTTNNAQKLASVTDPVGAVWGFGYVAETGGWNMAFTKPGISTAWLTNHLYETFNGEEWVNETVASQEFADGSGYGYTLYSTPDSENPSFAGGELSDAMGATTVFTYDFPVKPGSVNPNVPEEPDTPRSYQITDGPTEIRDPLGRVTTANYCDRNATFPPSDRYKCLATQLQSYTAPETDMYEYSYSCKNVSQLRQKPKPGAMPDPADIVTVANYFCNPLNPKIANKISQTIDANGNTTNYTYSTVHGGILTAKGPAVNGVQPERRYDYALRSAWVSDGVGGYAADPNASWLLTEERICKVSAMQTDGTCAAGAGDLVLTTYDYGPDSGPNNLLLRGKVEDSAGLALRTCYAYDELGTKISETKPNALLGSCP